MQSACGVNDSRAHGQIEAHTSTRGRRPAVDSSYYEETSVEQVMGNPGASTLDCDGAGTSDSQQKRHANELCSGIPGGKQSHAKGQDKSGRKDNESGTRLQSDGIAGNDTCDKEERNFESRILTKLSRVR